jgi:hypothetical protein
MTVAAVAPTRAAVVADVLPICTLYVSTLSGARGVA